MPILSEGALIPHPDGSAPDIRVTARITRVGGEILQIDYVVTGDIGRLAIPMPERAERRNELWSKTCFELFFRDENAEAYHEFNFSPSHHWAAYRFASYREGMRDAALSDIDICIESAPAQFTLTAWIDLGPFGGLAGKRLNLSAVIEDANGEKSYWALAHPPGKPDFHHPDCFALALPAPERA